MIAVRGVTGTMQLLGHVDFEAVWCLTTFLFEQYIVRDHSVEHYKYFWDAHQGLSGKPFRLTQGSFSAFPGLPRLTLTSTSLSHRSKSGIYSHSVGLNRPYSMYSGISCGHEALETMSEHGASVLVLDIEFSNPKNSSVLELVIYVLTNSVAGTKLLIYMHS